MNSTRGMRNSFTMADVGLQVITLLITIVGNFFVLVIYGFTLKSKKEDRYFIPILAVFDLLAGVVSASYFIIYDVHILDYPSEGLCKSWAFLSCFSCGTAVHLIMLIALQRYLLICKPHLRFFTKRKRGIATAITIISAFLYACPTLKIWKLRTSSLYGIVGKTCSMEPYSESDDLMQAYFIFLAVVLFLNAILVGYFYAKIGTVIYRRFKRTRNNASVISGPIIRVDSRMTSSSNDVITHQMNRGTLQGVRASPFQKVKSQNPRTNFNGMFLTIIIVYLAAYLPLCVLLFTKNNIHHVSPTANIVMGSLWRLYILNHISNPFIYGYFDLKFRKR